MTGKCSQCGSEVQADWLACPKCGAQFTVGPEHVALAAPKHTLLRWVGGAFGILIIVIIIGAALGAGGSKKSAAAPPSPAPTREPATVSIEGTSSLLFSGSIQDGAGGHSVQGVVPSVYNLVPARVYSVVFQKKGRPGVLTVTITCNGQQKSNSTNAEFGVVNVTCS